MPRAAVLVASAVAALAAAAAPRAAPAAAGPRIVAHPALRPAWHRGTPDYTVRCHPPKRVRLSVRAPHGVRVKVGGQRARSGRFKTSVALAHNQALIVRVLRRSRARVHYVRCLPRDFPGFSARRHRKPASRWLIVTPSHKTIRTGYLAVFDSWGVPVWWLRGDPPPFGGELLPDDNLAWTRWVFGREPLGHYVEHRLDGSWVRTYDTDPAGANAHELRVLPNGDYYMVRYVPRHGVDLSPWGGPRHATVIDAVVEELDPTGRLLWRWSTADHVALAETARWYPRLFNAPPADVGGGGGGGGGHRGYDLVHLNSIEPVGDRVLVSLRHTDAVYEVDRATGAIVWKLGGTTTSRSLRIVGDRHGSSDFGGQHDARALDGGAIVTLHDNGTRRGRPPRALAFRIDPTKRTATLASAIRYRPATESKSSGSARLLPDGHWVVSWGNEPYVTELTARGRAVLTIRFASPLFSYRAYPVLRGRLTRQDLRRGMDALAAP